MIKSTPDGGKFTFWLAAIVPYDLLSTGCDSSSLTYASFICFKFISSLLCVLCSTMPLLCSCYEFMVLWIFVDQVRNDCWRAAGNFAIRLHLKLYGFHMYELYDIYILFLLPYEILYL